MRKLMMLMLAFVTAAIASPCHNPRGRSAVLRGQAIQGQVTRARRAVKFAKVYLYSSDKLETTTMTDQSGMLNIDHLPPDKYRLSIAGWGSVSVELTPQAKGYNFHETLMLDRWGSDVCAWTVSVLEG
jgi:hypothetical protein